MRTFPFNSRETYLQWRKNWKAKYAELSDAIRHEKKWRDISSRNPTIVRCSDGPLRRPWTKEENTIIEVKTANYMQWRDEIYRINKAKIHAPRTIKSHPRAFQLHYTLSTVAFDLMEELAEAKKEAGRQYAANKTTVNA